MLNKRKIAHVQKGIYPQLLPYVQQPALKKQYRRSFTLVVANLPITDNFEERQLPVKKMTKWQKLCVKTSGTIKVYNASCVRCGNN